MHVACEGAQEEWSPRRPNAFRVWTGAALIVVMAAACGGERQAESGVAVDAARPAPPADTGTRPPAADTVSPTQSAQGEPAPAANPAAQAKPAAPEPKPQPASTPAPKPPAAAPGSADTQPARTAQQQDTQRAQVAQRPSPAPDTQPAQAEEPDTRPTQAEEQAAPAAEQPAETVEATPTEDVAPLRDQYHRAPRDTVSEVAYEGWKQYNLNCARCHGEDVLGSTIAPHLIASMKPNGPINTQELFVQVVCAGRPEKGMPGWCALGLEMDKINAIYSYVHGRSAGEIGPGRPAVKQEG